MYKNESVVDFNFSRTDYEDDLSGEVRRHVMWEIRTIRRKMVEFWP
jgi:hypothetical protein